MAITFNIIWPHTNCDQKTAWPHYIKWWDNRRKVQDAKMWMNNNVKLHVHFLSCF